MSTTTSIGLPVARYYHIRSSVHKGIGNMSMTIGNRPIQMYTDMQGILREIRDSEGHPFISADIAEALAGMPASSGWLITPVGEDEPEPEEEIIPLEATGDGAYRQASGTVTARLMETLSQIKTYRTLIQAQENKLKEVQEQLEEAKRYASDAQHEMEAMHEELEKLRHITGTPSAKQQQQRANKQQQPAAPMIGKGGKLTKARTGHVTELHADDGSVSTLLENAPKVPEPDSSDLDDIPRV